MTRKDYILIAEVINSGVMAYDAKMKIAYKFAEVLKKDNPRFDKTKFLKACGIEGDTN